MPNTSPTRPEPTSSDRCSPLDTVPRLSARNSSGCFTVNGLKPGGNPTRTDRCYPLYTVWYSVGTAKNRPNRPFGVQNMTANLITLEMADVQATQNSRGVPAQYRQNSVNPNSYGQYSRINTGATSPTDLLYTGCTLFASWCKWSIMASLSILLSWSSLILGGLCRCWTGTLPVYFINNLTIRTVLHVTHA